YTFYLHHKLYILRDIYFSSVLFLSMFDNYLSVRGINEVSKFLDENLNSINPAHRKNMASLCNAIIEYEKGNYSRALVQASTIKTNTILFKSRLRPLLLKIKYEFDDFDDAKDAASNYSKYIMNNKTISDTAREKAMDFIGNYNELLKIKFMEADGYLIDRLKKKIEKIVNLRERLWFSERIDLLRTQSHLKRHIH
ncbi:MAG: hypothetical protein ACREBU_26620, partial [Nitrososphaera sp.]